MQRCLSKRIKNYSDTENVLNVNGQFQCLAKFLLKNEKQNPSLQLKRAYEK